MNMHGCRIARSLILSSIIVMAVGCGNNDNEEPQISETVTTHATGGEGTEKPQVVVPGGDSTDIETGGESNPGSGNVGNGSNALQPQDFSFVIVDESNEPVVQLSEGDILELESLPEHFNVQAVTSKHFKSVAVKVKGDTYNVNRLEETPIWTFEREQLGFSGGAGKYTLSAIGYTEDGALGSSTAVNEISITLSGAHEKQQDTQSAPDVFSFQIIDEHEMPLFSIKDGDEIDIGRLPPFFHLQAVTDESFESVSVLVENDGYYIQRLEEEPIWTVNPSDKGFIPQEGFYQISVKGHSKDSGLGDESEETTIRFTLLSEISESDHSGVDTAPVTQDDIGEVSMNEKLMGIEVLSNDFDPENQRLKIVDAYVLDSGHAEIVGDRINFTPAPDYVGVSNIVYTVSDGNNITEAVLSVNVLPSDTSIDLAWDHPTRRESGASLSLDEISGYEILYRKIGSTNYKKLKIDGGHVLNTTINDLTASEYEFYIATIDASQIQSSYSQPLEISFSN